MLKVRDQKGFTLIELLIVIAIIAILAAIAIPQFAEYRARGVEAGMVSDLKNLSTAHEGIFSDCQDYSGTIAPLTAAGGAPFTAVVTGNAGRCAAPNAPSVQNVRISAGDSITINSASTPTTYDLCITNPGATRTGRAAVSTNETGNIVWQGACATLP